jgi:hypothetical protein
MLLSLRIRQFRISRCFDAAMGFPGDGPFALTSKLKAKETARLKAEAEEENEKEKKRKAGESVAAESSSSTCVKAAKQELEHAFFGCAAFRDRITINRAHIYGGTAQPGVELKFTCNNAGCTAEKKGNFWYSNARTSKNEVTVDKPFDSAKYLSKAVDHLLDKHKDCLPSKEELQNQCTADGRPLQTKVWARSFLRHCVLRSSNPLC